MQFRSALFALKRLLLLASLLILTATGLLGQEHRELQPQHNGPDRGRENRLDEALDSDLKVQLEEVEKEMLEPFLGVNLELEGSGPYGRIHSVAPGSPAAQQGMGVEDQLLEIDGVSIADGEGNWKKTYAEGDEVELVVLRNGKKEKLSFVLANEDRKLEDPPIKEIDLVEIEPPPLEDSPCDETAIRKFLMDQTTFLGMQPDLTFTGNGVKVAVSLAGTPAEDMRLKKDDIITKVDGNSIGTFAELRAELARIPTGKQYPLELKRGERKVVLFGEAETHAENYVAIREVHCKRTCGCATVPIPKGGTFFNTNKGDLLVSVDPVGSVDTRRLIENNEAYNPDQSLLPASMTLYPNPHTGNFTLDLSLEEPAPLLLYVFNEAGGTVYYEHLTDFSGGKLSREVDLSVQAKGIYFLQITQKGRSISRKISME